MARIYLLQDLNSGNLEGDIQQYFHDVGARLVTRTGNIVENLEVPNVGAIFYIHHSSPSKVQDQSGKFLGFCSDQINLTGFDESSSQFLDANIKLEARLDKYLL